MPKRWVNRSDAIAAVNKEYHMSLDLFKWTNHVAAEKIRSKDGSNTIVRINRNEAKVLCVDFDAIAESHRTLYLYDLASVLEYFKTHGRR